jgi:hypothetical protein
VVTACCEGWGAYFNPREMAMVRRQNGSVPGYAPASNYTRRASM